VCVVCVHMGMVGVCTHTSMSVGVGDFSSRSGNPVLSYAHYHAIRQMGW